MCTVQAHCIQKANKPVDQPVQIRYHHSWRVILGYICKSTELIIKAADWNCTSWKGIALHVGWPENSTHTHTHTKFFLLSQYLVPFPGAPCGFGPVSLLPRLFWLQSQLASPPSFISSDPEQTNQIRWAKCPPRDSLCAYVLTDFRKVKHKENL